MTVLWISLAVMAAIALLFVLPPLLRGGRQGPALRDTNLAVHGERIRELEADLANGTLDETQFAQAKADLERDLLNTIGDDAVPGNTAPQPTRLTAAVVGVAIPALAFILYSQLGAWQDIDPAAQAGTVADAAGHPDGGDGKMPSVEELVSKLEERLQADPSKADGWELLGRTYMHLGRYADSVRAYAKAYDLVGDTDAQLLADYAEAMALSNDEQLSGEPLKLIEQALIMEPDLPKALWLSGMAAFQQSQYDQAISAWERLLARTPPESEETQVLNQYLAEARAHRDGKMPELEPIAPLARAETPAPATDTAEPANSEGASIAVTVKLDASLADKVSPGDTVFIYARAAEGPRMPLAISRHQVSDLPVTVNLTDAMAMMPAMKLSSFPQVVVGARVSRTGNAIPSSGDLEGASEPRAPADGGAVEIVIDKVVP